MTWLKRTASEESQVYPEPAATPRNISLLKHQKQPAFTNVYEEIQHLTHKLLKYGINYDLVVKKTPSRRNNIKLAAAIARFIARSDKDCEQFIMHGLSSGSSQTKRFAARHKPYIIALIIIQKDGCQHLMEYFPKQEGIFS
ncbi:hypothetical protein ACFFJY_05550 [Fictibacillus aquaticus]|uniref:hypothetical protein n=1 Tax=Fictibacillus aquaticus TaxID=2021314 RepID=UPI0013FD7298|nr:hypothetical protein [Fictibacillus aquaticus]